MCCEMNNFLMSFLVAQFKYSTQSLSGRGKIGGPREDEDDEEPTSSSEWSSVCLLTMHICVCVCVCVYQSGVVEKGTMGEGEGDMVVGIGEPERRLRDRMTMRTKKMMKR